MISIEQLAKGNESEKEIFHIRSEKKFSVNLTVDLSSYLEDKERELSITKAVNSFAGEVVWKKIKETLAFDCSQDNAAEKKCYEYLTASVYMPPPPTPLVLESLNICFPEILKNSIDAKIEQIRNNKENVDPVLKLTVEMEINNDKNLIGFKIQDNAGGFSDSFLNKQQGLAENNLFNKGSDKTQEQGKHLGGRGLGIKKLYNLMYRGGEVTERGFKKSFDISNNISSIELKNYEITTSGKKESGACSMLSSSFSPSPPITVEQKTTEAPKLTLPSRIKKAPKIDTALTTKIKQQLDDIKNKADPMELEKDNNSPTF